MIRRLMKLVRWLSRIATWLHEARGAWGATFAVVVVFLISWATFPAWELRVRIAGLVLQLLGVATVAVGLHKTRRLFCRPSLAKIAVGWFRRFPKFGVETRIVVGSVSLSASPTGFLAHGTVSPPPTASLEERIASLGRGLSRANLLIDRTQGRIEEEARNHGSALKSERRERAVGDARIQTLLEEAAAGGLYLEATGVIWLVLGVTLATASNEIVNLFVAR